MSTKIKRFNKGKSAFSKKKTLAAKPTAANQKTQILALASKVNKIDRKVSNVSYKIQSKYQVNGSLITPYVAHALVVPGNWTQVFGSNVDQGAKYNGYNINIEHHIIPRTEHQRVDCTVIYASPLNAQVVAESGGATSINCLPSLDIDYILYSGMAIMNRKRWKVWRVFRHTTLPIVTEASGTDYINSTRANRRHFRIKNPLRINNRNLSETWNQIDDHEVSPKQRIHVFCFNDNTSTLEGSPYFTCHLLATGVAS